MAKRGRPRVRLDEICLQWERGDRREASHNAARSLRAFRRHLHGLSPECLGNVVDMYCLAKQVRDELPCLCMPPFADPSVEPLPSATPTPEGDNRVPPVGSNYGEPGWGAETRSAPGVGDAWRAARIAEGTVVPVEHRGATLHFGEHLQYMMALALSEHAAGWREARRRSGAPDRGYEMTPGSTPAWVSLHGWMAECAATEALAYIEANDGARLAEGPEPEPGMYDGWPPAQPTGEPRMDDGSHLLASERGRRRIDPETGMRMIRTMVLTEDAWPHWEWSEDVAGAAGVGPWGPGVSFGTPEEPAQMSPRESMRGHLTEIGRLDLLHKYLPWEGDPPL